MLSPEVTENLKWQLTRCSGCGSGALVQLREIRNDGLVSEKQIISFYPRADLSLPVPDDVPDKLRDEFQEAGLCISAGANRAGLAMLRSTIDRILVANGLIDGAICDRVERAKDLGLITCSRSALAHEYLNVMEDNLLHKNWRPVDTAVATAAHNFCLDLLKDFYHERGHVESVLLRAGILDIAGPNQGIQSDQPEARPRCETLS